MLLIQNGTLYTMEAEQPVHGDVLIKDGKIFQIAEKIEPPGNAQVINAQGRNVFPGFIDPHSHIGISEEKITGIGDECNEGTTPITPTMRAIDAINPMDSAFHNAIAAGITGVLAGPGSANPIGGQFAFIKTHGRCVDEMGALRAITINAARICGVADRVGSLKVGKDADIVIYDGSPMEVSGTVYTTIIDGNIVWTNAQAD